MEFNYDSIMQFMQDYFRDFVLYSHFPETAYHMHDYFAPDLEFIPYMVGNRHISGRDTFIRLLTSHPSSIETLVPADIMVDDKQKTAVVLISSEVSDSVTKKVLVRKKYMVIYQLKLDEKSTIKIGRIHYFEETLPQGTLDLGDVFGRDPGMAKVLSED